MNGACDANNKGKAVQSESGRLPFTKILPAPISYFFFAAFFAAFLAGAFFVAI